MNKIIERLIDEVVNYFEVTIAENTKPEEMRKNIEYYVNDYVQSKIEFISENAKNEIIEESVKLLQD